MHPVDGFRYAQWASAMRSAYRKYWEEQAEVVHVDDDDSDDDYEDGTPKVKQEKAKANANTNKANANTNVNMNKASANADGGTRTTQLAAVCVVADSSWESFVVAEAAAGCGAVVLGLVGLVDPMPGTASLRFNAEVIQYCGVLCNAGDEWAARVTALPQGGATAIGIPLSANHIPGDALLVAHVSDCALRFEVGSGVAMGASRVISAAEAAVHCGAVLVSDWDKHMENWGSTIRSNVPTFEGAGAPAASKQAAPGGTRALASASVVSSASAFEGAGAEGASSKQAPSDAEALLTTDASAKPKRASEGAGAKPKRKRERECEQHPVAVDDAAALPRKKDKAKKAKKAKQKENAAKGGKGKGGKGKGGKGGGGKGKPPCFSFQKGQCDRGDECRFSHEAGAGGGSPRGKGGAAAAVAAEAAEVPSPAAAAAVTTTTTANAAPTAGSDPASIEAELQAGERWYIPPSGTRKLVAGRTITSRQGKKYTVVRRDSKDQNRFLLMLTRT